MSSHSRNRLSRLTIVLGAVALIALSGCGGDDDGSGRPTATPTSTTPSGATATPSATAVPATATASATRTRTATAPPSATPTLEPTATTTEAEATATASATPTATTTPPGIEFVANASGDQEVPPVVSDASATALLTLRADRSAVDFEVDIEGLDPADITQAHIHVAPRGFNGPIVAFLTGDPPFQLPLSGTITADDLIANADVSVETFADFVAALEAGDAYVNVHTLDNPAGEVRGQVHGATEFVASLSGGEEVPPVEGVGAGTAVFTLNASRSALDFEVEISGLDPADITQAHIHAAPRGFNGAVVAFLTGEPPFEPPLVGTITADDLILNADAGIETFSDLVAALEAGDIYVNVHTMDNPGGEIRGQLRGSETLVATLSGDQEVEPVETDASGRASIVIDAREERLRFAVTVADLPATEITQAHIHVAPRGFNGPVVVFLAAGSFTNLRVGSLTPADLIPNPDAGIETFADLLEALRAGDAYVNVHTMDHPGGEIRGQIDAALALPAMLSGDQEVDPVETDASGSGQVVLSADRQSLRFALSVTGLEDITQAHIHVAPRGVNGPVVLFLSPTSFGSLLLGTLTEEDFIPVEGVSTFADFVDELLAGNTYMNVHSIEHMGGEVRGQLQAPRLFIANLTGDQEVDPVETDASGLGQVVLSADESSLRFALSVFDLANITMAHIHVAEPGVNGPVVLFLSATSFNSPRIGTLTAADFIPVDGVDTFADFVQRLIDGGTYMNVHTMDHPGGEVRGQLE